MISMPVIKKGDPMLGIDVHDCIVPPAPAVVKFYPHAVAAMIGWVADHDALSTNVLVNGVPAGKQFHDIKNLVPHVPLPPVPNVLLAITIPFSGSKVMLGSSTVLVNDKPIGVGPLPVLNCGDPLSLPTGAVVPLTNVFAGVSLADLLMALAVMLVEMGISFLANVVGGAIGGRIAGALSRRMASRVTATLTSRIAAREMRAVAQRTGSEIAGNVIVAVEREIGQSMSQQMTRETAERASFLFTERATRESFEASQQIVARETVVAASENGVAVAQREVVAETSQTVVRETYERSASEASEAISGKVVETGVGNTAGNAAGDAAEGFGQGLLGAGG